MEEIDVSPALIRFKGHLEVNPRVIFSARFGEGKTSFLNKFKEQYSDEYYFITLYPVNYSIAANDDIFEYIKRDIIVQLANNKRLDNIDIEAAFKSLRNIISLEDLVSLLLQFVPGGETITKILACAKKVKDDYVENRKTYGDFLDSFKEQRGGLYEEDAYTLLIKEALDWIKKDVKLPRKPVLVIEDLDRLDPGHLFRILNVLGAHLDSKMDSSNKFGFDNIVVVMDYAVSKSIFHHFYGSKANFDGYMGKFMSHYPFEYSINEEARNMLYAYIETNCSISQSEVNKISLGFNPPLSAELTFYQLLRQKNVRDIANIMDQLEDQVISDVVQIGDRRISIKDVGIIKLLSIIKRMGDIKVGLRYLEQSINDNLSLEYLNMLGPFMFVYRPLHDGFCFLNKGEYYCARVNQIGEIATCSFIRAGGGYIEDININKIINNALTEAGKYIRDFQFSG